MEDRTGVRRRLDLHNISIDFAAARAGSCRTAPRQPAERAAGALLG